MTPLSVFLSRYLPPKLALLALGVTYAALLIGLILLFGYEANGPQILYLDLGR